MDMDSEKVVCSTWGVNKSVLWGFCFTQKDFERTGYAFYAKEVISWRRANQVRLDMRDDTTDLLAGTSILSCWRDMVRNRRYASQVFTHRSFCRKAILDRLFYILSCLRSRVMSLKKS